MGNGSAWGGRLACTEDTQKGSIPLFSTNLFSKIMFKIIDYIKNIHFRKRMVAYGTGIMSFTDDNSTVYAKEDINFYLYESIFGRSYDYHSHGKSKTYDCHKKFEGEIKCWVKGGPIPEWFTEVTPKQTETKRDFTLLKFPRNDK